MTIAQLMAKMIAYSECNLHDIDHLIRVWTYARTIAELKDICPETRFIIEAAAILHDIACPLCRRKYGSTEGSLQEKEGIPLTESFLAGSSLSQDQISRICYLVGHHHTLSAIDGIDCQILIEADYLANAAENAFDPADIRAFTDRFFKTSAAKGLCRSLFRA